MQEDNILGQNIERGWKHFRFKSRRAFAIAADVEPDTVRSIIRGKSKNGRADTLEKIARALHCTPNDLKNPTLRFVELKVSAPAEKSRPPLSQSDAASSQKVGRRMRFIRIDRMVGDRPDEAVATLGWQVQDLLDYESGERSITADALLAFSNRFEVDIQFILLGTPEVLSDRLQGEWAKSLEVSEG